MRGKTTLTLAEEVDRLRLRYGFWIIIARFVLVAFITIVSTFRWTEVTSVATVVGAVATLVGTVVKAFFGVQVGLWGEGLDVPEYQRVYKMLGIGTAILADGSLEESGDVMGVREVGTSST